MRIEALGIVEDGSCPRGYTLPLNPPTLTITTPPGASVTIALCVVTANGCPYEPASGDVFTLTLSKSAGCCDEGFAVTGAAQTATGCAGLVTFDITPNQTRDLCAGQYVYDVWLTKADGSREPLTGLSAWYVSPSASHS